VRLTRRMTRDTEERGRTFAEVIEQYHATVRPMHNEWVEPSKKHADLIVQTSNHSLDVAVKTLSNHLRVEAGIQK
jgi:uridine kinase